MPDYRYLRSAPADLNRYVGRELISPEEGRDFDHFRSIVSEDFEALGDNRTADAQACTYNDLNEPYAAHVALWNAMRGHTITASKHAAVALELGAHAVYDFGCGVGSDLMTLALEKSVHYLGGHDICKWQVDFVKWRFEQEREHLHASLVHMEDSPAPRSTAWEHIYSIYVLEHLPDPEVALDWMCDVGSGVISLTTQFGKTKEHPEHNDYDVSRMDEFMTARGWHRFHHKTRPLMPRMYVLEGSKFEEVIDHLDNWRR